MFSVMVIIMISVVMVAVRMPPLPILRLMIAIKLPIRAIANMYLNRPLAVIALLFRPPLMVIVIVRIVRPVRMGLAASLREKRCGNSGGKH